MAIKPLKQSKPASKPVKEAAASKSVTQEKKFSGKQKAATLLNKIQLPDQLQTKVAAKPVKPVANAKLTKPAAVSTVETGKKAATKLKESVKKTPVADKIETKAVVAKKEITSEKKVKADVAVEKEPKKTASKAQKSEVEVEKASKPVIIPKTSTTKKVDYQPDFLKSVLDTPAIVPQGPTMRYSDAELQEFRDLINKKLDAAKKELGYLQGLITRRDEMGGDETDNRYMTMEDGGMSMEREQLSQMASRQITFIDHLEKAIMRIENKTYGICRVTGKLIDKARLRAVPHATLSMEAKLGITK
ncbi:MAG TPA: TraR/DksA C4-type zinc finger protein [Segetibacter sp.]